MDSGPSSNLSSLYLGTGSALASLPRPPTGALRPPVAVGPADATDSDSFGRRAAFVERGASLSYGKEEAGWTPWNAYEARSGAAAAEAAPNATVATGVAATGGWGIAEIGFEIPQMAGMPAHMPGPVAAAEPRQKRSPPASPRGPAGGVGLQLRQPSVSINPRVEHVGQRGNLDAGRYVQHGQTATSSTPGVRYVGASDIRSTAGMAARQAVKAPTRVQQFAHGRQPPLAEAKQWVASHSPPMFRTPIMRYPSGVLVNIQEHAGALRALAAANAPHRQRIVECIESGELVQTTLSAYQACDREQRGSLSWNDGEIRDFITRVFQEYSLSVPSEAQMGELYAEFDVDRCTILEARECLCLVDALFRAVFIEEAPSLNQLGHPMSRATSSAGRSAGPSAATFILTPPPSCGNVVAYEPQGQRVPGSGPPPPRQAQAWDWPNALPEGMDYSRQQATPAARSSWGWPTGDHPWAWPEAASADRGADAIREAHSRTVQPARQEPLPPPGRGVPFDGAPWPEDASWSWGGVGEMIFGSGKPSQNQSLFAEDQSAWPRSVWPSGNRHAPSRPGAPSGQVQALADRPYQVYSSRQEAPLLPAAAAVANAMGKNGGQAAEPTPDWPEESWTWKSLFSGLGGQQQQSAPPVICPACGNVYLEGSRFCRKCGTKRPAMAGGGGPQSALSAQGAPSMVVAPDSPQKNWKTSVSLPVPQGGPSGVIPTPGAGQAPRPPSTPAGQPIAVPEVPMWRDQVEQRKHIIDIDLEEVRLHRETPDLVPEWHQSTKYYLSFHPFCDDPGIPLEAPTQTKDGQYAVSQSIAAKEPPVKGPHLKHIPFKEKLVLHTDYPLPSCQILLWGKKGNLAHEEIVLLGKSVVSLFDYSLQRRLIPWHVMDFTVDAPAAEMYMKFEVKTTPGPVQLLHLTDVQPSKVTLHWTKPLNDHGSPIQGYKVDILLDGNSQTGPQWHTLCACTKTLNTAYVVENLTGNTEYLINVSAVNMVGEGDLCEFQIQTAPIEPTACEKPWIQEARDGCLCVAWHATKNDGGTPVTAYKVQMMKLVGGSKNPLLKLFGPSEKDAAWADIGSVGAVMDEVQDQPSVYTVWAGPLDSGSCEYRFRVYAVNHAGVSKPSELTDAHYTA